MNLKWILMATLMAASLGFGQNSRAQVDPHPNVNAAFPEIHDWNTLRITLSRSGCYGRCPAYKIEIHGDGTVLYDGKANVAHKGSHTTKISHASLMELVARLTVSREPPNGSDAREPSKFKLIWFSVDNSWLTR